MMSVLSSAGLQLFHPNAKRDILKGCLQATSKPQTETRLDSDSCFFLSFFLQTFEAHIIRCSRYVNSNRESVRVHAVAYQTSFAGLRNTASAE